MHIREETIISTIITNTFAVKISQPTLEEMGD